jgi:hypothetical protein
VNEPLHDIEARLRGIPASALPPRLKERVLQSADLPRDAVTWRDHVWYSRGWRLAAAAACLAVLAAEAWVAPPPPNGHQAAASQIEREALIETGKEVGLPASAMASLAVRVEFVPVTAWESRSEAAAVTRALR